MRSCIACSIPYNPSTSEEISFHRFPKDEPLKNTWIKVCQIEEAFKKVKDAVVCSQHFQLSDYYQTRFTQKILFKESVPSQMLTINKISDNLPNLKNTNFHIPGNNTDTAICAIIVKHEISGSKYGNCSILDAASILHVSSGTKSKTTDTILDEDLAEFKLKLNLENDGTFFTQLSLSQFIEDVVVYISGFVIKKVKPIITCHICCSKLTSSEYNSNLIKFKIRGKLILPSEDVILLCLQLERAIRITDNAKLLIKKNLKELLTLQAIRNLPDLFGDEMMVNHIKKQSLMDNHRIQLIKLISTIYLNVRIHYECRKQIDHKNTGRFRQKCVKLILFRNE